MNLETIRAYCLKKKGKITEGFPFGEDVLVFKVSGKIFLLARVEQHPLSINLKCDSEKAIELRERHEAVRPGYHMNKKFWTGFVAVLVAMEIMMFLVHGVILKSAYEATQSVWRPDMMSLMWSYQKWPRLFEQLSPIYKWTPGGLRTVQSCPRRRASLATYAKPRWTTRGAPRISSYAASAIGGNAARYFSFGVSRSRLE